MFKSPSIAWRLWAPTVFLALMLFAAGTLTTVRTQALIREATQQQSAQLDRLQQAQQWRNLVSHGEDGSSQRDALRSSGADDAERQLLQRAADATEPAARLAAAEAFVVL